MRCGVAHSVMLQGIGWNETMRKGLGGDRVYTAKFYAKAMGRSKR